MRVTNPSAAVAAPPEQRQAAPLIEARLERNSDLQVQAVLPTDAVAREQCAIAVERHFDAVSAAGSNVARLHAVNLLSMWLRCAATASSRRGRAARASHEGD